MSVTININNLTLVHRGSNGVSAATMPDVCKTPPTPVPVPYPNISFSSDLVKGTKTVTADGGKMCAIRGSQFFKSTGDEPGVAGGVVSGVNMKESTWITFSFDVKFEGKNACRLTDKMFHNHSNTVNAAGELQRFVSTKKLNVLCNVFCETYREWKKFKADPKNKGKSFPFSKRAEQLGKGKYGKHLAQYGMKAEARTLVRVGKAMASRVSEAGRRLLGRKEVLGRVGRQVGKQALKTGAKIGGKTAAGAAVGTAVGPVGTAVGGAVSLVSNAIDVVEVVKAAGPLAKEVVKAWAGSASVGVIPDVAIIDKHGNVKDMYDYKGPWDRYRKDQDQIMRRGTGKAPKTVSLKTCNNCKKKMKGAR